MTKYKILFTGAHHNSALTTLDWLNENGAADDFQFSFAWIGTKKYISELDKSAYTPEYLEVTRRQVDYFTIKPGKLYRFKSIRYIPAFLYNLFLIPVGFVQAFGVLLKSNPDLICSFGGYISVPVVIAGWLLGIPSVTHEQTTVIGLANKIIEKFVIKTFTAWPVSFYTNGNASKLHYVGLPLRKNLLYLEASAPKHKFANQKPVLYITGGKSGSYAINKLAYDSLKDLTEIVNIIWSCGHRIDNINLSTIKKRIADLNVDKSVIVKEYFTEDDIGMVFKTADFVLSRSGAHTIYELALLKKPALLVPIPWASNNEQYKNAKILVDAGMATILQEDELSKDLLMRELKLLMSKINSGQIKFDIKIETNGEKNLGEEIIRLAKNTQKT